MTFRSWTGPSYTAVTNDLVMRLTPIPKETRLAAMLEQIATLDGQTEPAPLLERFILCQFALAFHVQVGGLTLKVASELIELSRAILKLQGSLVVTGKLSWLSGEMHILMGQVFNTFGRRWDALWQQEYGLYFGTRNEAKEKAFSSYTLGQRLLRLGYAKESVAHFQDAIKDADDSKVVDAAHLSLVRAHFMSGSLSSAIAISEKMLKMTLAPNHRDEVLWGMTLFGCLTTFELAPLLTLSRKNETYKHPSYQLELALWMYAWPDDRYHKQIPSSRYLRRKFGSTEGFVKDFLHSVEMLQDLYEGVGSNVVKIEKIEELLSSKSLLVTIDKEVLLTLAVLRWLKKARWPRLARFTELDLRSLGFRLTDTQNFDFWGLLPKT